MAKSFSFDTGCLWEDNPWRIDFDVECSEYGGRPCPHSHTHRSEEHTAVDGSLYTESRWINPRVVVVINEGGCNSTGLCLDCLLGAVGTLEQAGRDYG